MFLLNRCNRIIQLAHKYIFDYHNSIVDEKKYDMIDLAWNIKRELAHA